MKCIGLHQINYTYRHTRQQYILRCFEACTDNLFAVQIMRNNINSPMGNFGSIRIKLTVPLSKSNEMADAQDNYATSFTLLIFVHPAFKIF
jgi:hypothetical protein